MEVLEAGLQRCLRCIRHQRDVHAPIHAKQLCTLLRSKT
jgi:hypothetical protein